MNFRHPNLGLCQKKKTNIHKIQIFQSKTFRLITNDPPYFSNLTLRTDLKIPTINKVAKINYTCFHKYLLNHSNPLIHNLSSITLPRNPIRRLKRHEISLAKPTQYLHVTITTNK